MNILFYSLLNNSKLNSEKTQKTEILFPKKEKSYKVFIWIEDYLLSFIIF